MFKGDRHSARYIPVAVYELKIRRGDEVEVEKKVEKNKKVKPKDSKIT